MPTGSRKGEFKSSPNKISTGDEPASLLKRFPPDSHLLQEKKKHQRKALNH